MCLIPIYHASCGTTRVFNLLCLHFVFVFSCEPYRTVSNLIRRWSISWVWCYKHDRHPSQSSIHSTVHWHRVNILTGFNRVQVHVSIVSPFKRGHVRIMPCSQRGKKLTFPPPAQGSSPTASCVRFNMFLEISKHVNCPACRNTWWLKGKHSTIQLTSGYKNAQEEPHTHQEH